MILNDGSQNLLKVLKEIIHDKGRLSSGTVNYLAVFVVTAIVLNGFLVTAFLILLLVVRILMGQ